MIDDIGFDDIGVGGGNFFVTLETLGVIEIKLWSSK